MRGRRHAAEWRKCLIDLLEPRSSLTQVKNLLLPITFINMQMCIPVSQRTFCSIHQKHGFIHPLTSRLCHITWRYVWLFLRTKIFIVSVYWFMVLWFIVYAYDFLVRLWVYVYGYAFPVKQKKTRNMQPEKANTRNTNI